MSFYPRTALAASLLAGSAVTNPDRGEPSPSKQVAGALRYSSVGLQLVFSVLVAFGIGYLLDRALGTRPWLMLVFFVLGMAAGFLNVYRAARASDREDDCSSKG